MISVKCAAVCGCKPVRAVGKMSSLQDAWSNFQGGVKSVLHQWTALRLAVENNWGGGDSERKAALLEEELLALFRTKKQIYKDEVENFLADFLDDNFSTYAEDNSPAEVGAMLVEMFAQCGRLDYTLANAVRAEEERLLARKATTPGGGTRSPGVSSSMSVKGEGGEDDSSSDEEDDTMGEDEGGVGTAAGGSGGPDEDGWETIGSKKGDKGRRR